MLLLWGTFKSLFLIAVPDKKQNQEQNGLRKCTDRRGGEGVAAGVGAGQEEENR